MKEVKLSVPLHQEDVIDTFISDFLLSPWKIKLGEETLYIFRVSDNKFNSLLHELQIRGVGTAFGEISITNITILLKSQQHADKLETLSMINIEETLSELGESSSLTFTYIVLVIISAVLASLGLVGNNVVIIIGSMIVAPLMGPIALTSLGLIVPGRGYFVKGLAAEVVGTILTGFVGFIIGIVSNIHNIPIPHELLLRADLTWVVLVTALMSGLAAGFIITRNASTSIIGVAIAASLAPPTAAVGLFLAGNYMNYALQAFLVVILNILAINFSCALGFLFFQYSGKTGASKRNIDKASRRSSLMVTLVGVLFTATILTSIVFFSPSLA